MGTATPEGEGRGTREIGHGAGPDICDGFANATVQSGTTKDRRSRGQVKRKSRVLLLPHRNPFPLAAMRTACDNAATNANIYMTRD